MVSCNLRCEARQQVTCQVVRPGNGAVVEQQSRASLATRTHARSTILPRLASAAEAVAGDVPAQSTWPGVDASVFIFLPA